MVMEYAAGGELKEHLTTKGRQSETEARRILIQIINAIEYCHSLNVVHRDLKLENILFADERQRKVKIVDFGIAGLVQDDKPEKSKAGSLRYMAPEILSRENIEARPSIDIWSIGCILFALVCGELPFNGSSREIKSKVQKGEFQFPQDCTLSYHCRKLIKSMLTVDYRKRIAIKQVLKHPWLGSKESGLMSISPKKGVLAKTVKQDPLNAQAKAKEPICFRRSANFIIKENTNQNKSYHKKSTFTTSSHYYDQRANPFEVPDTAISKHIIYYPSTKKEGKTISRKIFYNEGISTKVKKINKEKQGTSNIRLSKSSLYEKIIK